MTDYKELVRRLQMHPPRETPFVCADAIRAIEKLAAEVERWNDPDSDERQKLQEEIIFNLGDGSRSEVELREGQLDATEAALALARAEIERLKAPRMFPLQCDRTGPGPTRIPWSIAEEAFGAYVRRYGRDQSLERLAERGGFGWSEMDTLLPGWRGMVSEVERLTKERDEALAARETYAMTARQDIIEKAKALDGLETWLTSETRYDRSVDVLGPHARATKREFELTLYQGGHEGPSQDAAAEVRATTLAAAIRAALEKARGA